MAGWRGCPCPLNLPASQAAPSTTTGTVGYELMCAVAPRVPVVVEGTA